MHTRYVVKYKPDTLPRQKMVYNEYTNGMTDTIFAEIISSSIYLIKYNCNIGPSVTFIELYSEVPADMKMMHLLKPDTLPPLLKTCTTW